MKNNQGTQNWGEPNPKPSNEWGNGPEASTSRGTQGPNKSSGRCPSPVFHCWWRQKAKGNAFLIIDASPSFHQGG